jgi:hypothetical protein
MKGVAVRIGETRKHHPRKLYHWLRLGRLVANADVNGGEYPALGFERYVPSETTG